MTSYLAAATAAVTAMVLMVSSSATAQPAPPAGQPLKVRCSGPSTFERWGLGTTAADWGPNKKPFQGAGSPFDRTYTFDVANNRLSVRDNASGQVSDDLASEMQDYQTTGSVRADGANYRFTIKEQYSYVVVSISIYWSTESNSYRYKYLDRDEDRNRLIFELYKSESGCMVVSS